MTLYNDAEREKLINELKEYAYASNNTMISVYKVCDFILADRKRICDPILKWKPEDGPRALCDAKNQTLKNAGLGDRDDI